MSKKAFSPLLAALSEVVNKLSGPEESLPLPDTARLPTPIEATSQVAETLTPASDLHRIADALERIAVALEKLSVENTVSLAETSRNDDQWITLPDTPTVPSSSPKKSALKSIADSVASTELKSAIQPEAAQKDSILRGYLAEQGITIQEPKQNFTPEEQVYQSRLEEVALYLGQNFGICQELYKLMKRKMIAPRASFDYSLVGFTATQNKQVREFCRLLKEAQLLEEPTYHGKPEYKLQLKATGKEQKYLSGSWLERYVKQEVARIAQPHAIRTGQRYEALSNLYITFKDGSKTELDLFFVLGQQVFCVEAKTKLSSPTLQGYLNKLDNLGLDARAILIVVADGSEEECLKFGQALGGVRVACLTNFEQTLKSMLEAVVI